MNLFGKKKDKITFFCNSVDCSKKTNCIRYITFPKPKDSSYTNFYSKNLCNEHNNFKLKA